jgi:hypothetical protein
MAGRPRGGPTGGEHGLERGPALPVWPPGRVGPGQPQQIECDEVSRPLARRPGRPGATPLKRVLQLEGETTRDVPYDQLAVQRGRIRQLRGPAPTSGNAGSISVPRLERSTTRPASTETRARNPSHFGYALLNCPRDRVRRHVDHRVAGALHSPGTGTTTRSDSVHAGVQCFVRRSRSGLDDLAVPEGQPFPISPVGVYDVALNQYFSVRLASSPWNTQAAHARDPRTYFDFLWFARGRRDWRDASNHPDRTLSCRPSTGLMRSATRARSCPPAGSARPKDCLRE